MLKFLKTTVLGGIVFLVPLVIFIVVLGKAVILVNQLATPIAATFPAQSVGGLAVVHIVALLLLVFICFLAGLAARTPAAARNRSTFRSEIRVLMRPGKIKRKF